MNATATESRRFATLPPGELTAAGNDLRKESLAELCKIVAQHKTRDHRNESGNLFTENDPVPTVTPDLSATFTHMEAYGYVIGRAVKFFHGIKPGMPCHTEWHVQVTRGRFMCTLAFLVPEDVS